MKIVIIGQKWLAAETLKTLFKEGLKITAVAPENEHGRLAETARQVGVQVINMTDITECDLILAAHCHRYIPKKIRERSRLGVLAYHPSLLPRHRGRDAVHWTVAMKDPVAGGTVYWMDDGVDTGPIQARQWCFTRPDDTSASLWRRELGPIGLNLLTQAAAALAIGVQPVNIPQDEAAATWEPRARATRL